MGLFTGAGHLTVVLGVFTVVMVLTVVGGWLLAWRGRGGWAQAGVILASLGLWDGARSLLFYVGLLGVIAAGLRASTPAARGAGR